MGPAEQLSFQTPDYVVFGAMFVFTMAIGIRYAVAGKGSKSRETYFVADRKMHFIPVAFSLMVTFESAIMMLGLPAEVYIYGTSIILVLLGAIVTHLLTAVVAVPLLKPLKITSVYEYLQRRFQSRRARMCGVVLFLSSNLFYMGIVLYAQSVAIEAVAGVNMWVSILVMDTCAVLYTSLGGIKSVVWTDVFQAVVMFTGIFAVIIKHGNNDDRLYVFIFLAVAYEGAVVYAFFSQRQVEPLSCGLITNPNKIATSLLSAFNAPLVGLFLLACFFPSTNARGAIVGVLVGSIFAITFVMGGNFSPNVRKHQWLSLGNSTCGDANVSRVISPDIGNFTPTTSPLFATTTVAIIEDDRRSYNNFFSLSYNLFSAFGITVTVIVGLVSSHVLGRNRPGDVNPRYFLEISDSLLVFLPPRLRRWLKGFGPQFKHGWKISTIAEDEMDTLQESANRCQEKA